MSPRQSHSYKAQPSQDTKSDTYTHTKKKLRGQVNKKPANLTSLRGRPLLFLCSYPPAWNIWLSGVLVPWSHNWRILGTFALNYSLSNALNSLEMVPMDICFKFGKRKHWKQSLDAKSAGLGGSVGCAVRLETRRSRVQPRRGRQHSFVEIDHEIFSTVILSLPLIQEGQLSVSGERMCTILVNRLED